MTPDQIQEKYKVVSDFFNSYDSKFFKDPSKVEESKQ